MNNMVVQFNIPFQVFKRFKEKAKPAGEILAFLAGCEKNDVVTVTHIIFPIQYHPGTEDEVVYKGILYSRLRIRSSILNH